ncbi:inositol monophosphatase family protein [Corynebacterium belfantii]|uniref:inositol monophosphatase family protein n=3 Tax=Corynebacterium belfantii TaxID=2014537 RepID=UPI001F344BD0|nr:inositol monophosphatase family protein [Corynebacterium belfantii]
MRPDDGMLGEEGAESSGSTGITWIVDPIDGTVNFIYGIPQYAVSLAACIGENIVAGAVINVATSDLYVAANGSGAFVLRGDSDALKAIEVSTCSNLQRALIASGFSYSSQSREDQAKLLVSLLPRVRDIRRFGSVALDLCAVAEGRVDGYYEHGLNAWDFAAGALIAQEAGAKIRRPELKLASSAGGTTFG